MKLLDRWRMSRPSELAWQCVCGVSEKCPGMVGDEEAWLDRSWEAHLTWCTRRAVVQMEAPALPFPDVTG